jgi:hypothetical protein
MNGTLKETRHDECDFMKVSCEIVKTNDKLLDVSET